MIRPRPGDFCYSAGEFEVMLEDIKRVRSAGAKGVVLGILTSDGAIDAKRTKELVAAARPMKVTFNRAFDVSKDLNRSLEEVFAAGADRILTSGGDQLGTRGAGTIAELVKAASERITLLGAGGIRHSNVREFVEASGVNEVHTSVRPHGGMPVKAPDMNGILTAEFGGPTQFIVRGADVLRIRRLLDELTTNRKGVLHSV